MNDCPFRLFIGLNVLHVFRLLKFRSYSNIASKQLLIVYFNFNVLSTARERKLREIKHTATILKHLVRIKITINSLLD